MSIIVGANIENTLISNIGASEILTASYNTLENSLTSNKSQFSVMIKNESSTIAVDNLSVDILSVSNQGLVLL